MPPQIDTARCDGCGKLIRPGERFYDYCRPGKDAVARCHSERLACLIAWNERWHAANGHGYNAAFYRRSIDELRISRIAKEHIVNLTYEQQAAVAAINAAVKRQETFSLHGLAGTGKTTVAAHVARSRPGAYLCALTGKAASVLCAKTGLDAATVHSTFYKFVASVEPNGEPRRLEFRPAHLPGSKNCTQNRNGRPPMATISKVGWPDGDPYDRCAGR
jgi:hypothetical protein